MMSGERVTVRNGGVTRHFGSSFLCHYPMIEEKTVDKGRNLVYPVPILSVPVPFVFLTVVSLHLRNGTGMGTGKEKTIRPRTRLTK